MAKVQIKSERITPFKGIFNMRELFSRYAGPVIDKVLNQFCSFALQAQSCMQFIFVRPRISRQLPSDSASPRTPLLLANDSRYQGSFGTYAL